MPLAGWTSAHVAKRPDLQEIRKQRVPSVVLIKKVGTRCVMRVQPASLKFHVKGAAASEPAQRAAETRTPAFVLHVEAKFIRYQRLPIGLLP